MDLLKDASFGSLVEANSQQSGELLKLQNQLKSSEGDNRTLKQQLQQLKSEQLGRKTVKNNVTEVA